MRIACVGGGPAGLYFGLLMKLREPRHDVTIYERNASGLAYGWGVVFWDDLLEKLRSSDPASAREIDRAAFRWVDQIVDVAGEQVLHAGDRGYSISRRRLLDILTSRAQSAGVRIEFDHEIRTRAELPAADLVVACDGASSRTRLTAGGFHPEVRLGGNKYLWLGTRKVFESFTFPFVRTGSGWVWAHAYGHDQESSTFVVECSAETWRGLGFDKIPPGEGLLVLQRLFADYLDGAQLVGRASDGADVPWLNFRHVSNSRWYDGTTVLMGDAAHTTHFTIGSGTKLAIEDAIALADKLQSHGELGLALASYDAERRSALSQPAHDSRLSAQWFENLPRYIDLAPAQFGTLLRERRSPLLPLMSPQLYCRLHQVSQKVTLLGELRRRMGPAARAIQAAQPKRAR